MKKILSIFFMLLIAGSVVYARRTETFLPVTNGVGVIKTGHLVKVYYKASEVSDVKVSIYDAASNVVFKEVIKNVNGFLRPYNFANMPYGEYTIEVISKNQRTVELVDYQKQHVRNLAKVLNTNETNKYLLLIPNKKPNKLTIRVFNDNGELLHIEEKKINNDFACLYNLASAGSKFYFLITDIDGKALEVVY